MVKCYDLIEEEEALTYVPNFFIRAQETTSQPYFKPSPITIIKVWFEAEDHAVVIGENLRAVAEDIS